MLEKFHAQLVARKTTIEQECFDSPPKDWAEFQHRLGGWIEVSRLIADIEVAIKGEEDDML